MVRLPQVILTTLHDERVRAGGGCGAVPGVSRGDWRLFVEVPYRV